MSSIESSHLARLLDRLVGGELSAEDAGRLNEVLAADAAARRRYLVFMEMHGTLHYDAAPMDLGGAEVDEPAGSTRGGRGWSWRWAVAILILAGLVAGMVAWRGRDRAATAGGAQGPREAVSARGAAGAAEPAKVAAPVKGSASAPAATRPDLAGYYAKWATDPRVLGLYDFQPVAAGPATVRNLAGGADGRFVRPKFEPGRFAGRVAMRTGGEGQSAAFDFPGPREALTLAAWVNVASLDGGGLPENGTADGFYTMCILMTDSQPAEGQYVHWQFNWAGQMSLSVNQGGPQPNYNTLSLLGAGDLNAWHHVAMTFDLAGDRVKFFFDGKAVYAEPVKVKRPLTIGRCRVGEWLGWYEKSTGRRLDGKVDELLVLKAAASDEEIAAMYEAGRPADLRR